MRIVIIVVLALVALASAGIWALGAFAPAPEVMQAESAPAVAQEEAPIVAAEAPPPPPPPAESRKERATPAPAGEAPAAPNAPQSLETEAPADDAAAPEVAETARSQSPLLAPSLNDPNARIETPEVAEVPPAEAAPEPTFRTAGVQTTQPPASLADQFKTRKVAYNRPPKTLFLDRPIDISLVIDATAAANPAAELEGFPGEVVERDVDLSDTVSAQLTGVGFDIVSQTVARQNLSSRIANRWQWRVTPTEPGTRTIILEIFGYAAGSLDAEPLDAYRDEIKVEVQQLDAVITWAKGVQPLFAVIAALAGALSALIAFLRFRADKKRAG